MSLWGHAMSEDFKAIRITLSDEAFGRLENIIKEASFRSYSSAIEECIRIVSEIALDVSDVIGVKNEPFKPFTESQANLGFNKIATRMQRITGRRMTIK